MKKLNLRRSSVATDVTASLNVSKEIYFFDGMTTVFVAKTPHFIAKNHFFPV